MRVELVVMGGPGAGEVGAPQTRWLVKPNFRYLGQAAKRKRQAVPNRARIKFTGFGRRATLQFHYTTGHSKFKRRLEKSSRQMTKLSAECSPPKVEDALKLIYCK